MNPTTGELLQSGLVITILGMGLVFASLAVLWALLSLLTSVLQDGRESAPDIVSSTDGYNSATRQVAPPDATASDADALTAERARVAAAVAGAVAARPQASLWVPPGGPSLEQGRIAPSWMIGIRAHPVRPLRPSAVTGQPAERSRD